MSSLGLLCVVAFASLDGALFADEAIDFETHIRPMLEQNCYDFDNIADVLTISPLLLEKYISAAKEIVDKAIPIVSGVAPRRSLAGGLFTKEILTDVSKAPEVASLPKGEPVGNRFARPMLEPPKDDPIALTMSYKEHSIGKMTTNVAVAGRYKIEVNIKTAEQFVDNVFDYNRCQMLFRVDDKLLIDREFVRQHAEQWRIDPIKIGIVGFSAGAELSAPAAVAFDAFDSANNGTNDPLAGTTSRPDFVGIIYPGPSPFARDPTTKIPRNTPPAFITCAGAGDRGHAIWANEYFTAMLRASIPNVEMHIYGNG